MTKYVATALASDPCHVQAKVAEGDEEEGKQDSSID